MKLKDVFILTEKVLNTNTHLEALNEWWYSNSTLYTTQSSKITSKWLKQVFNIVPAPKILSVFPDTKEL